MVDNNGMQSSVTVLGLGQMGTRLAQAFLAAGHHTTVWNRTPAKAVPLAAEGAETAASPAAAIAASPLVVVCLPDYATVRKLIEPASAGLRGRTLVNLTSGTPDEARELAAETARYGAAYLDGAAMSGTRLVGSPEALFVMSGSEAAAAEHRGTLAGLGNVVQLGAEPGLASVYDTALFGLAWGALAGFHHATALAAAAGVAPEEFAAVAADHMPFVTSLMAEHGRQLAERRYPDDDGTVAVHAAAMEHLADGSRQAGLRTDVPELALRLLARAAAAGHGADGIASVGETFREPADG
ncbi:NAD(P)-dependent oxidoreductase [Streptomyces boninensis]|uniref:NAD(P)-dependent oxidoreductase n=1 Tax=Streptomyces boninensis TaxID=2039455 RepID=UPI003B210545